MAGTVGFEPTDAGTKNQCLTTWRRPITLADNSTDYTKNSVKMPVLADRFFVQTADWINHFPWIVNPAICF